MTSQPVYVEGLGEIVQRYDAFVVDQWGVIHDGRDLYRGVTRVFRSLRDVGKPILILTNSRKRAGSNIARLRDLGLLPALYDGLVSSAEVLRNLLTDRPSVAPWDTLGDRAYVVALDEDSGLLDGTSITPVTAIANADFVLLLSIPNDAVEQDHDRWLRQAADRHLPVISSSAEPLTINSGGVFAGLAGLARRYEAYGGTVVNVGKPNRLVYEECSRLLPDIDRSKILAIGDQFESDVVGAKLYGYDAAMVLTGTAEVTFREANTPQAAVTAIAAMGHNGAYCDWLLPTLQWDLAPKDLPPPAEG